MNAQNWIYNSTTEYYSSLSCEWRNYTQNSELTTATTYPLCASKCSTKSNCTHFIWKSSLSKCWMRSGKIHPLIEVKPLDNSSLTACGYNLKRTNLVWSYDSYNQQDYAGNCFWTDSNNIVSSSTLTTLTYFACGSKCASNVVCTHFTWYANAKSCKLFKGAFSPHSDAQRSSNRVCGYDAQINAWNWNSSAGFNFTHNCDWYNNDISSSSTLANSTACASKCKITSSCTHFTWISTNKTCFLKKGPVEPLAAVIADSATVCGFYAPDYSTVSPALNIIGKSSSASSPIIRKRSVSYKLKVSSNISCMSCTHTLISCRWRIYRMEPAPIVEVNLANPTLTTAKLGLLKNSLSVGSYKITLKAYAKVYENGQTAKSAPANDTTYLKVIPTGLRVRALPNALSNVWIGSLQVFKLSPAVYTIDPDKLVSIKTLKFKFYCQLTSSYKLNFLTLGSYTDLETGKSTNSLSADNCFNSDTSKSKFYLTPYFI